jgi:hypothetical protein
MEIVNVSFGGGMSMQLTPVVCGLASTTPSTILEGETITLTFTTNTPSAYPYTITGVSSADIGGAPLTGTFTANGETRSYTVTNDFVTEGPETFLMTLDNGQAGAAFTILDRYFTLTSNVASVSEKGANSFTVTLVSSNTFPVPYTVTGVNAADFVTGNISGNFMSNGETLLFTVGADVATEGPETFLLTLDQWPNANVSVTVNDTSNSGQQAEFTTAGTYSWVAPPGVTSVSVVAVGAGGSGKYRQGGGGGALSYKISANVTPGNSYTVIVGAGGTTTGETASIVNAPGGFSSFGSNIVYASGGTINAAGRSFGGNVRIGDGGGNGGSSFSVNHAPGGGGAGGYSGNGGDSITAFTGENGQGGGGGGGGWNRWTGAGGGGVGIYGEGTSGAGGAGVYMFGTSYGGGGGSGGQTADAQGGFGGAVTAGGGFGGGSGGTGGNIGATSGYTGNVGGGGAVRIIWGAGRAYPSTNTANE